MIKYLEKDNLLDVIPNEITLVDFYADWCGPCKMLGSVLENLNVNIIKINTDKFQELSQKYGIMSIPTVLIYKDKKEVSKFIGFKSKIEIEEILNNL